MIPHPAFIFAAQIPGTILSRQISNVMTNYLQVSSANQQYVQESVGGVSKPDSVDSGEFKSGELDAQARAERTKAKNKRAQKKFRQKQKERHEELERSATDLSAKLKTTLAELDALQNQKRVLEIALSRNIDPLDPSAAAAQVAAIFELPDLEFLVLLAAQSCLSSDAISFLAGTT